MRGVPQDYMKLGIAAFMAMPEAQRSGGAAVRAVERVARDDYFSCIDVFPIVDRGARAEAISIAREAELDVYLGAQGLLRRGDLDIGSLDPRKRREAVDAVKAAFEEACEWPAVGVVVSSGPAVEKPKREKALRALVESLTELTKAAGSMAPASSSSRPSIASPSARTSLSVPRRWPLTLRAACSTARKASACFWT